MSKVSSLKTVGYCKDCHYWIKPAPVTKVSLEWIECKKDVSVPVKGMWGCRWWKEDKRRKR